MTADERIQAIRDRKPPELGGPDFQVQITEYFHGLGSDVRFLLSEIDRLKALHEWQPIETVPKDGEPILGCHQIQNVDGEQAWTASKVLVHWKAGWTCFETGKVEIHAPTRWMPLPRPPEVSE